MNDNDIMKRLILGNVGDETALGNICEAHNRCMDELAPEEKEHMYATNSFYYSAEEFSTIHSEETDALFHELLEAGTIVATKDGFVWVNCDKHQQIKMAESLPYTNLSQDKKNK